MPLTLTAEPYEGRGAARVIVTGTGYVSVTVWTSYDNRPWQIVRGGQGLSMLTGLAVIYDTEYPFGAAIRYQARQDQAPQEVSNIATFTDPGDPCLMHIGDPIVPALGAWFEVTSRPELETEGRSSIVTIVGRREPVAVTDVRGAFSGSTQLYCPSHAEVLSLRSLNSSGRPLVLRYPSDWDEPVVYVVVGTMAETRVSGYGSDHRRWVALPWTEVAQPFGDVQQRLGSTYQALKDYVPDEGAVPLDYRGITDHNASYQQLLLEGLVW